LPEHVQNKLFTDFLFIDFLETFHESFKIKNKNETIKFNIEENAKNNVEFYKSKFQRNIYYTWEDECYSLFMKELVTNLEPRI